MRAGRLFRALGFFLASLSLSSGCALLAPPSRDQREPARSALAHEAGRLEKARLPQEGPAVTAYREAVQRLEPEYAFPGTLIFGTVPAGGYELGVILLEPPGVRRGTIIAYHGYLSFSLYNLSALFRIAEQGWAVLAVDLPGHGFSDGPDAEIRGFSSYAACTAGLAAWVEAQGRYELPRPLVLLGHSAGGAAVISTLLEEPELADGAILLAPLVRPRHFAGASFGATFLSPFLRRIHAPWEDGYLAQDEVPLSWIRALGVWAREIRKEKSGIATPLLVLQGESDDFLDWEYGMRFLQRVAPLARFALLPGRRHILLDRKNGQKESLAEILPFLDGLARGGGR